MPEGCLRGKLRGMRWIALLALSILLIGGCAHKKPVSADPLGAAPTDFSIELTVLTGPSSPPSSDAHLRQSRYVLFADGSLHQGDDLERVHGADWLPPLTRILTRRQMAEIWSLCQQLGFVLDPAVTSGAINFKLVQPSPDGVTYLAGFSGWGERWTFDRPCSSERPDPAMVQLTRALARLAWATDLPPTSASIMPKRYDFGPDPYARYRTAGGAPAATTSPAENQRGKP